MSLIKILSDGPEVSFKGSPTVSPITAALCASDPFGPSARACSDAPACVQSRLQKAKIYIKMSIYIYIYILTSMYFLALSQAPPVLEAEMATYRFNADS